MADETKQTTVVAPVVMTIDQIQEAMGTATANKDWKQVSKLANQLVKAESDAKAAELKAKQDAIAGVTAKVKSIFDKVVDILTRGEAITEDDQNKLDELLAEVTGTELDVADGVWYSNDFGAESGHAVSIRLMKGQAKEAKARTEGSKEAKPASTGGGKKFDISTEAMIAEVGESATFGDGTNGTVKAGSAYAGQSLKAAYDSSTDKNWRYQIRTALLKHTGRV